METPGQGQIQGLGGGYILLIIGSLLVFICLCEVCVYEPCKARREGRARAAAQQKKRGGALPTRPYLPARGSSSRRGRDDEA
eukprot:COSAG01_NODE_405_length_17466_cov_554.403697_22_plen_82_part_00